MLECSGRAGEFPRATIDKGLNHPQYPIDNNLTRNQELGIVTLYNSSLKANTKCNIKKKSPKYQIPAELLLSTPPDSWPCPARTYTTPDDRPQPHEARERRKSLPASRADSPRRPPRFASSSDHRGTNQASPQQERGESHARAAGATVPPFAGCGILASGCPSLEPWTHLS